MKNKIEDLATQYCKERHKEEYDDPTFSPDIHSSFECYSDGIKKGIEIATQQNESELANLGILTGKSAERFRKNMENPKKATPEEIKRIQEAQKLFRKISKNPNDLRETVDWFREKHKIEVAVKSWFEGEEIIYLYSVRPLGKPSMFKFEYKPKTYNEALTKAIEEAFKLI